MLNLAVKKNFEKNLPLKVYGNLNINARVEKIYHVRTKFRQIIPF